MLDPDDANSFKYLAGEPLVRHNVEYLGATELANLRHAVQALMDLDAWPRDNRNYNSWAQMHGDQCPHGWSTFLPWHRMYLWDFEQALRDGGVSDGDAPYWDWTQSTREQIAGGYVPEAFRCWVTDEMLSALSGKVSAATLRALEAVEGQTFCSIAKFWTATKLTDGAEQAEIITQLKVVNPLFNEDLAPGEFAPGQLADTFHMHYPTKHDIERILALETWRDFGGGMDIDQSFGVLDMVPHNTMHVWIGGPSGLMTSNLTAAFDPIFWAHHSNVDRLWALWQERHPGVDPSDPADFLPSVNSTVAGLAEHQQARVRVLRRHVTFSRPSRAGRSGTSRLRARECTTPSSRITVGPKCGCTPSGSPSTRPSSACSSTTLAPATRPRSTVITMRATSRSSATAPASAAPRIASPDRSRAGNSTVECRTTTSRGTSGSTSPTRSGS